MVLISDGNSEYVAHVWIENCNLIYFVHLYIYISYTTPHYLLRYHLAYKYYGYSAVDYFLLVNLYYYFFNSFITYDEKYC